MATKRVAALAPLMVFFGFSLLGLIWSSATIQSPAPDTQAVTFTNGTKYDFKAQVTEANKWTDGAVQTWTVPATGWYKLQVWGATADGGTGAKGGYSVGLKYLTNGTILYIYNGGAGAHASGWLTGGWNGGGGIRGYSDGNQGTGGGATDIRTVGGNWDDATSLNSRVIVAGGGGGGIVSYTTGYGGGATGSSGYGFSGGGGTQTAGGSRDASHSSDETNWCGSTYDGTAGALGKGGSGCRGGGGGGYYGGGGGVYSGGGGSGYIGGVISGLGVTAETVSGNASMPTWNGASTMTGNNDVGHTVITRVNVAPSLSVTGVSDVSVSGAAGTLIQSSTQTASVATENPTGYTLTAKATTANNCLRHSDYSSTACASVDNAYKINSQSVASTTAFETNAWAISKDGGTTWLKVPASSESALTLKDVTSAVTNDSTTIKYGAKPDLSRRAGAYSASVTYTLTAKALALPTITAVDPPSATVGSATTITITGTNLSTAFSVKVGGTECTSFTIFSSNSITCAVPALSAGAYGVTVSTWGGAVTLAGGFTFVALPPAPVVTSMTMSPNLDVTFGGDTTVTVTGQNLSTLDTLYYSQSYNIATTAPAGSIVLAGGGGNTIYNTTYPLSCTNTSCTAYVTGLYNRGTFAASDDFFYVVDSNGNTIGSLMFSLRLP
jgi:hypothetical protein